MHWLHALRPGGDYMTRRQFGPPRPARDAEHSVVYHNDSEFCCWPFLCGLWKTAEDHLVVGFMRNNCSYASPADVNHDNPERIKTKLTILRSEDRGRSWNSSRPTVLFDLGEVSEETIGNMPESYSGMPPIDFKDRNVLVASGALPDYFRPKSRAWVRVSTDGGRSWRQPILPPLVGLPSLSGHASALVRPDGVSLLFMTATSADGWTRRPVVYASVEDGSYWTFLSFMMPRSDDDDWAGDRAGGSLKYSAHRRYLPRPILLADGRILASLRCQRDPTSVFWTEIFESEDGGFTWRFVSRVNDWGAPGDLVQMKDGRIACVYGYRLPPYGVRARISEDDGRSWGSEIIIRDDGGSWDLGYPRVTEIEDGRLLVVYYMNRKDDSIFMGGGVRHIAQTIFTPA